MGTNQSSYLFCPIGSLFGHIIKMLALLTNRSWVVLNGSRLDLMHWYIHHCVRSVLVTLIPQRSHTASQWLNTNWLDVLDFWGYPNQIDPHVCVSFWQHCTVSWFLKFLLCLSGFYLTPSSSYEVQREAISDFGWLERFTAMFTVTDETDMQKNTPFKIATFLLP